MSEPEGTSSNSKLRYELVALTRNAVLGLTLVQLVTAVCFGMAFTTNGATSEFWHIGGNIAAVILLFGWLLSVVRKRS